MRATHPARINIRLLVLLAVGSALLMGGLVAAHYVRKRSLADRALASGRAAAAARDWPEAARQLRQYLSAYPNDSGVLREYAEAQLSVRPQGIDQMVAAISAYNRLRRFQQDREIYDRLYRLYTEIGDHNQAAYIARQRLDAAPSDAGAMICLASSYLAQRMHADAQRELKRFIEKSTAEPRLYVLLAEATLQEGPRSQEAALKWLDTGIKLHPRSPDLLARRARYFLEVKKDLVKSRSDLEAVDQLRPPDPELRLGLAEQWMQHEDWDRAAAELAAFETLSRSPEMMDFEVQKQKLRMYRTGARLALRSGDREGGVRLAERGLTDLTDSYRQAFLSNAISLHLAAERLDAARRLLDELHRLTPAPGPALTERLALLDAMTAVAEGKPHDAIRRLEAVTASGNPRDPAVWRHLAYAYLRTGQERRAAATMERYLTREPDDAEVALDLARVLHRQGNWEAARRFAEQAGQHRPDAPEPAMLAIEAELQAAGPKLPAAQADRIAARLTELQQKFPDYTGIPQLQAWLALQRQEQGALAHVVEAFRARPDVQSALEMLELLRREDRLDEAIALATQLAAVLPPGAPLPVALSDLQAEAGRREDARTTLEQAAAKLSGPDAAQVRRALGRLLLNGGQTQEGIALLRQIVVDHPDDIATRLALLEVPEVQKDENGAQNLVNEIREIEGDNGLNWRIKQAELLLAGTDWRYRQSEILQLLNRCTEADPGWEAPVILRGRVHELLGNEDQAEENYRRYADLNPGNIQVTTRLLDLLERQGRFLAATRVLERSPIAALLTGHSAAVAIGRGDYPAAIRDLKRRIAADPKDASARVLLAGLLHRNAGDVESALRMLDEAARIEPDLPQILATRIEILQTQGRSDDALALLDSRVSERKDFSSYLQRARLHLTAGRIDDAEKDFEKLTTFEKTEGNGFWELGKFFETTARPEKAIAAYERGLRADAADAKLQRALLRLQLASPDSQVRQQGEKRLAELEPRMEQDEELQLIRADYLLSRDAYSASRQAAELLERLLQTNPRNIAAHMRLIRQAMQSGELSRAAQLAIRATGANPESSELLLLRASIEAEMNNPVAARELAGAVLSNEPRSVAARNLLAQLALREDRLETAESMNQEALKAGPDDEDAHLIRAAILNARGQEEAATQELESYCQSPAGRSSARPRQVLAEMYCTLKNFEKAREHLAEVERIAPHDFGTFLVQLKTSAAENRPGQMLPLLAARLEKRPSDSQAVTAVVALLVEAGADSELDALIPRIDDFIKANPRSVGGNLAMATAAYQLGDAPRAESAYRRIIELEPYHREALNNLAWLLTDQPGRLREALDLANKAVLRYPEDASLLNTRGVIHARSDELPRAHADLEKCLTLQSITPATRARTLAWLGRIALREGQPEQAREWFAQALKLDTKANALSASERREIEAIVSEQPATRAAAR